MHIYATSSIQFTSANRIIKPKKQYPEIIGKIRNNLNDDTRKGLYSNIDSYLTKKFSKKEFLLALNKLAIDIDNKKLNTAEKKYLNDMLTTMDLSDNFEKIPDKYIVKNIEKLIDNQQKI